MLRKKERELFQGTPCYYILPTSFTPIDKIVSERQVGRAKKKKQSEKQKKKYCWKTNKKEFSLNENSES